MKKTILLITSCVFLIINCKAQIAPAIQWQNTIGGNSEDRLFSIQQTVDGGYILGGHSWSNISCDKTENSNGANGFYDYWIVKTDSLGNIQWQNTIGGNNNDQLFSIQQTFDRGYILGGYSTSNISGDKTENCIGGTDYWIVKTDSLGNIQWQNTIGGNSNDQLFSIQQTLDRGYILGGHSMSNISGDKTENSQGSFDYWIVKIDSIGNIQWQNTIGGNSIDHLFGIRQTNDGGYILGGVSLSDISGDKSENCNGGDDYWIVKTDSLGNIQWQNTIGGDSIDFFQSISQTIDGGYIIGGYSYSNTSGDKTENNRDTTLNTVDYWIVKIDTIGNIQWQKTIGGNSHDDLHSIWQTVDGGYILGGMSCSSISGEKSENCVGGGSTYDYWVVKIDSLGTIQWDNTIGGDGWDLLYSIQQTRDKGYLLGGYTASNTSGDKNENNCDTTLNSTDYWIVKLFPDTITGINNIPTNTNFSVYPNPFNEELAVRSRQSSVGSPNFGNKKIEINIYNVFGEEILSQTCTTADCKLPTANLSPGVYFVKVNNEIKKVVKIK